MAVHDINPLILEKLDSNVLNPDTRNFLEDILVIERDHKTSRGKMAEYEKALAKYVRVET